ncbi:MAG TPA: putative ABC exporter domain-containing protein [Verrucomicrobiae bacterium]|nr:putative ABC exporter domain-containing protein [Verrucomicrobiae bacterium]
MNRALLFLWTALLRGRALRFMRGLRRPTSCLGLVATLVLLGFLFYFRNEKLFGQLVRKENLVGAGLIMVCGSIFKGFLQRGLRCEPADIEFLFTSPFTHRQIVLYRLLPNYLFAVVQSLVFLVLFAGHLSHPLLTALCVALFQIACFHISTAFALWAGTVSDETHLRVRWMMLASFFLVTALYLRLAWNFRVLPAFCSSPVLQLAFYPAVNLSEVANASAIHRWIQFGSNTDVSFRSIGQSALWLAGFGAMAAASLWWLMRFKANPFEAGLSVSYRTAEQRRRVQQGRTSAALAAAPACSMRLPKWSLFQGAGALVWKNYVAVRRARKEMLVALFFTLTYTGAFTALLWIFHDMEKKAGPAPLYEARAFTTGIAVFLGMLAFFLQRMFPFDFRHDGPHLLNFRTLPISAFGVALAEIAVPTLLCLCAQACGVIPLMLWGKFDWPTLLLVVFGFPAVALALNSVWNLHYLMAAAKQISGRASSSTAVGMVLVVALSFLVLYPAGWATIKVANLFTDHNQSIAFTVAAGAGLAIQYGVDLLLVLAIGQLFRTFELSREA